jgi:polysaccharide biosynthesis transport protein
MESNLPVAAGSEVNLRDYLDVLRRRKAIILQTFVVVLAVGVFTTLLSKPVYETSAKLLVATAAPSMSIVTSDNPLATLMGGSQVDNLATQIEVLNSGPFMTSVFEQVGQPASGDTADQSVRISQVGSTNVVQVTVQSRDPQYAAKLANTIVTLHNQQSRRLAGQSLDEALEFVKIQSAAWQEKLDQAERALQVFRKKHHADEADLKRQAEQQAKLTELEAKHRELDYNLQLAVARKQELQAQLATEPAEEPVELKRPNPKRERLAARLLEEEERLEGLREQFTDSSTVIYDQKQKIAALEARLKAMDPHLREQALQANADHQQLRAELKANDAQIREFGQQKARLIALLGPAGSRARARSEGWELELASLERERAAAEKVYLNFAERARDLEIRQKAKTATNRIIETAPVPSVPIRPKKATNILLTIALATCLGLAMAFLQEYLDDRINSPEDADRAAHLPLLGYVPAIADAEPTVVTNLPARSHVAEAYRTLRSSIGFAAVDGELKTLMVTSASKGEGKTVTSLNLAIAMALDGKNVILVDADLRRPNVHKQLKMVQGPGLTDVLVGQRAILDVLQQTEVAGLRVLTSGPIPPNPAELLNSAPMDRVIEELQGYADIVIFDTAPVLPVSDSLVLGSKLDGVVLVVYAGETKKAAIKHTRELLDRARARTVGLVFNRVPQRKGGYYYYYYYYGGYYEEGPGAANGSSPRREKRKRRRTSPEEEGTPAAGARRESQRSATATHDSEEEES